MTVRSHIQHLAWLGFAGFASAQVIIDSLSFGNKGVISPQGQGIPGWEPSSVNHDLQILSDRIILTPPYPGQTKGGLWTQQPLGSPDWSAELEFRASGQDVGSGNIQVFLTSDKTRIGTNSIYNVEQFDGLAVVVDQYGGRGGTIRGFLNDGTQNFRTHSSLESLAFGHCDYQYRNLGRYSKLKISHAQHSGLTVTIDDRTCFSSNKISFPANGNYFGVTAATGDNPDSFEVSKFLVAGGTGSPQYDQGGHAQQQQQQQGSPPPSQNQKMDRFPGSPEAIADSSPDDFKSQTEQFTDVHNRLQILMHHMANVFSDMNALSQKVDAKHDELMNAVRNMQGSRDTGLPPDTINTINQLRTKVENIERTVDRIKSDFENRDYRNALENLQHAIANIQAHPEVIGKMLHATAPRMSWFIGVVVVAQVLLAVAYVLYKRRRAAMPKKYL